MTMPTIETRTWTATLILDAEDAFARSRGFAGPHPRPIGGVRFRVVAEMVAGGRRALAEPLELKVTTNDSGYRIFRGEVATSDGSLRAGLLGPGRYEVRADTDFYQPLEVDIDLPAPPRVPAFVDLQPDHRYPFREVNRLAVPADPTAFACGSSSVDRAFGPTLLRGTLHNADATPIDGAIVEAEATPIAGATEKVFQWAKTDTAGQWVLWFPDTQVTGRQTVRFVLAEGAPPIDVPDVCIARGYETRLGETAIRGDVRRGDGAPIADARIRVSGHPPEVRSRSDGGWSYYFALDQAAETVTVSAELPGGPTLQRPNVAVAPHEMNDVPTFQFP
ncbi:MAG: hypothetical protein L0227_15155 [Chloroflexi bacterium]|nr:hypothetical protein [Chloroflexota bacterium]